MLKKFLAVIMAITLILALSTVVSAEQKKAEAIYGTPTIDGEIDDAWKNAPEYDVDYLIPAIEGYEIATGKVKAMWDEKHIYLLYVVEDDNLWAENPLNRPWLEDSVCTFYDENNNEVIDGEEGDGAGFVSINGDYDAPGASDENFRGAVKITDNGYIAEIEKTFVSIEGKEGYVMGIEFSIDDAEDFGEDLGWQIIGQSFWSSTGGVHLDYTLCGKITFVKTASAAAVEETTASTDSTEAEEATDDTEDTEEAAVTTTTEKPATTSKSIPKTGENVVIIYSSACILMGAGILVSIRKAAVSR